jgi:parallel beta-helix repeat protein
VYYVAMNGNDGAAGTSAAPFRTLQHAVNVVQPGDTVLVESGTYVGCRIGVSGTAAAPITLAAAPGASVLIDAPGPHNYHKSDIEVESFAHPVNYWTISGLQVDHAPRDGIDCRGTNFITIQNCTTHNNGAQGIFFAFSNNPTIQNNVTYGNVQHGIYDSNSGDNPTIIHNVSHDNLCGGIQLNGDVTQGGDGIISNALIADNVLYNNGVKGGAAINLDGVQNSVIENNLLYNNHASGIALFQYNGGGPSSNNLVAANTIDMATNARWALTIQNGATGNTVEDNILYDHNPYKGSINVSPDSLPGLHSDYNVVMNSFTTGSGNLTLAQWQAATGQDTHSVIATPSQLFVNEAMHNYNLSASSPAVGAGTWQNAPSTDMTGALRPAGQGFDTGALAYGGGSSSGGGGSGGSSTGSSGGSTGGSGGGSTGNTGGSATTYAARAYDGNAVCRVTGLAAGTYTPQVSWAPNPAGPRSATYYIYDGYKLLGTAVVNPRNAPVGTTVNNTTFQSLGSYTIKSGSIYVVLVGGASGNLSADQLLVS